MTVAVAVLGAAMNDSLAAERCVFPNDYSVLDVIGDFGAKVDGVAADTAALQAGLAACSSRNLVVKAAVGHCTALRMYLQHHRRAGQYPALTKPFLSNCMIGAWSPYGQKTRPGWTEDDFDRSNELSQK